MPTLEQINQISFETNNDISNDPIPNFYKSATERTIRCPEGMVFSGSHVLSTNGEDLSVLRYDGLTPGSSNWFKSDGSLDDSNSYTESLVCDPKYCGPQGIVNSDKEFDALVDNTVSETITCNDGYVFDTTNTKLGNVKCGTIPIVNDDGFNKENEVAWIVDNPAAEVICNSDDIGDETQCERTPIPYIISSDTDKLYENHERQLNCTWIPEIPSGGSGFTRNNGYCKFIHRADFNDSEPICRSMYCSQKSVPYSNRIESEDGPLPGPETGAIHGKCVDFDGQIIDNIINSSDCACFKHKSGDVCVYDNNCQWCGYNPEDGSGGYCYSTKTHLDICNINSIANNRGGVCNHTKKDIDKPNKPPGGWAKETCETNICVNENYWNGLTISSFETPTELEGNYNPSVDIDTCEGSNQEWYSGYISHNNNECILENNKILDEYSSQEILLPYYPLEEVGDVKLNIDDYICVPIDGSTSDASACNSKHKYECVGDATTGATVGGATAGGATVGGATVPAESNQCEWIENPLRDSIFNWNRNDKIKFVGTGCPALFSTTEEEILFNIEKQGENIKLNGATFTSPGPGNLGYINTCRIVDVKDNSNIFDSNYCSNDINETSIDDINDCHIPNIKYCPSFNPNEPGAGAGIICPHSSNFTHTVDGEDIQVDGCKYLYVGDIDYDTVLHNCKENYNFPQNYEFKCSPEKTLAYNCSKYVGSNDESSCTNTNYKYYEDNEQLYSPESNSERWSYIGIGEPVNFKDYLLCNTNIEDDVTGSNDELRCNMIGQDKAHWGKLCEVPDDGTHIKIPVKHISVLQGITGPQISSNAAVSPNA